MQTKTKFFAATAIAAALVMGAVIPASAATTTGYVGPCGGPTYPTVQLKIDSYGESHWRTSPTGSYLSSRQWSPNVAVYHTAGRQAQSYSYVAYGDGKSFQYFDRYCN